MWVVDTCVLLDILDNHPVFGLKSADALDIARDQGLSISSITYVELAPAFNGEVDSQNDFLAELGVSFDFRGNEAAVLKAHRAWYEHILRKRAGDVVKRPIADVVIGAYAQTKGGLITRNEDDFNTLYPSLRIYNPISNGESANLR